MTYRSSDQLFESLSALADGEASEFELHRILKTFGEDPALQERWQRYHLMRAIMRKDNIVGELQPASRSEMLSSIRKAILGDETPDESVIEYKADSNNTHITGRSRLGWHAWLGKSAVASSVAMAFVVGLGQMKSDDLERAVVANFEVNPTVEVANTGTMLAPLGFELPALESRVVSASFQGDSPQVNRVLGAQASEGLTDQQSQAVLNQLHILHAQRSGVTAGVGLLPFARISEMVDKSALEPSAAAQK